MSKLCVSKLWVSCCMCVSVGGRKEAGGRGGGGTDGSTQPKTRTPHKDVGKKMLCQPKQMVNLTTKIVMSANIWTLKSHKHWLVAEDFGPSFLYEMTIGVESASMCKPCLGVPLMLKKS